MRQLTAIEAIKPGQRVKIGGQIFRLRYITYHQDECYYFESGDTEPSPLFEDDVLTIRMKKGQKFEWEIVK
ncbi:hypothetical protein [Pantoea stewartii]|uniref:hypothetical protein n=1 Tax=Pantoea stewartii TaxID=66269 RepID=UPI0016297498|nr:hypothetical protein [Pantoea stewartii]MBC0853863.1 hypothetical protein [Pantoea stewartii]